MADQYPDRRAPLDTDDFLELLGYAFKITQEFPVSRFDAELAKKTVDEWTQESWDLAVKYVYEGVEIDKPLSDAYQARARELTRQQVALGGYRLAQVIADVF